MRGKGEKEERRGGRKEVLRLQVLRGRRARRWGKLVGRVICKSMRIFCKHKAYL